MPENMDEVFKEVVFDEDIGLHHKYKCWHTFLSRVYGWNNNTTFFAIVPYQWQNYYRNTVQTCINFAQGYDPTVHGNGKLIPTRTGAVVIRTIVDQIMSGDVQFDDLTEYEEGNAWRSKCAKFIGDKWAKDFDFIGFLFKVFTYSLSGGSALIKLNIDGRGNVWPDALRIDRFFVNLDSRGRVVEAKCYVDIFEEQVTDGGGSVVRNWFMVEYRYYKDGKPYIKYLIMPVEGLVNSRTFSNSESGYAWKTLPQQVKDSFKANYGTTRVNEEIPLKLPNLGCELLKNTASSIVIPDIRFGDSQLLNAIPLILALEQGYTNMINDQYIGKGVLYTPGNLTEAVGSDGMDQTIVKRIPYVNPSEQQAEAVQFSLRVAEWEQYKDMQLKMIADAVGLTASSLSSHLQSGAVKTATEISSEDNRTANTVENKRALAEIPINRLLNTVLQYYGITGEVGIRFSKAGLTNMNNLIQQTNSKFQQGTQSLEQSVTDLHPDWTKEQIENEIFKIEADNRKKMESIDFGRDEFGEVGEYASGDQTGEETRAELAGADNRRSANRNQDTRS